MVGVVKLKILERKQRDFILNMVILRSSELLTPSFTCSVSCKHDMMLNELRYITHPKVRSRGEMFNPRINTIIT